MTLLSRSRNLILSSAIAAAFAMTIPPVPVQASSNEPVWAYQAADWESARSMPAGWAYKGEGVVQTRRVSGENVVEVENLAGSLGQLTIPYDTLQRFPKAVIEIRIGARSGDRRGLNWFLKKGAWELRADNTLIFLNDPNGNLRTPIGDFKEGKVQVIRLEYSTEDQVITGASVDGREVRNFAPYAAPALGTGGSLNLFAPTQSGGHILFGGISAYADEETMANLPRWQQPVRGEEDLEAPQPPYRWQPVLNADELDFSIKPERLANPAFSEGILFSLEDFANLQSFIDSDPAMERFWSGLERRSRELLRNGHSDLSDEEAGRYTYNVRFITPLAFFYAATGEEHLGQLIREVVLDLMDRPMPFWVHSELRRYDPSWPTGGLETAELARSVALAALWAKDVFTDEEYAQIMETLVAKGLDPSLRWLEDRGMVQKNNWLAVIGGGALIAAIVLEDEEAQDLSVRVLERWLDLIEEDGSYGEPQGYFEYGYSRFFFGWWALGHERGKEMLQGRSLSRSLDWMVTYFIIGEHEGVRSAWRVNFGDDDFLTGPKGRTTFTRMVSESLAYAYNDGLGTWIQQNLIHPDTTLNFFEFCFLMSRASTLPEPVSPEEKGLPLASSFDNGVTVIRSGWDFEKDTVFALRSGGANRAGYAHDRPNRQAFLIMSQGDFLAIAPGRASYRSPLFREWDNSTRAHSTITLDGENQIRLRDAEIVDFRDEDDYVIVSSEARGSYDPKPETMLRTVWYLKELDAFFIEDIVRMEKPQSAGWNLLLSNFRDESVVSEAGEGGFVLQRNDANLSYWVSSDQSTEMSQKEGYMHVGYSYYPEDPFEGSKGSAILKSWDTADKVNAIRYHSVLAPRAGEERVALKVLSAPPQAPAWSITHEGKEYVITLRPNAAGASSLVLTKP